MALKTIEADGVRVFYREAGPADGPVYASNVRLYPKFQEYFRKAKPPLLAIWGKNDPFFGPPGAEAYKRDNSNATVQFLDTGHFALETHPDEIAAAMHELLGRVSD